MSSGELRMGCALVGLLVASAGCDGASTAGAASTASVGGGGATTAATGGQAGAGGAGGEHASWRSELYPQDWTPGFTSPGGHRIHDFSYAGFRNGEQPSGVAVVTTEHDVTAWGADTTGGSDATAAVQSAIDAAALAGGGVVVFPSGDYRFDGALTITASNVVLRGAGTTATRLFFTSSVGMSNAAHITFRGTLVSGAETVLAEDGEAFATVVKVADASALAVGDDVSLGWTVTSDFVLDHQMAGTWDAGNAFYDTWVPMFRREVVAIDTSTTPHEVTLDVPLRYPALVRDGASLRVETGYLEHIGVQDLALGNAVAWDEAWAQNQVHVLQIDGCKDCWVHNIASFDPPTAPTSGAGADDHLQSGGLLLRFSKRVTIADSELSRAQNKGGGGNGYLFEVRQSSEVLLRDLVATHGRHNFIQNWGFGVTGCVWLRVHSAEGRAWLNSSVPGLTGYSEFHHSLALANLIDASRFDDGWSIHNRESESTFAGHTGTETVIWNSDGEGVVRSRQFGMGYVVGTRGGITVDTSLPFLFGGVGTEPEDFVEGVGIGARLEPTSLYDDQLAQRLTRR